MADKPVRADKASAVAELTDHFRNSSATVLTEYRGLTVKQLTELRRSLGRETKYSVSKNTLAKRAASVKQRGFSEPQAEVARECRDECDMTFALNIELLNRPLDSGPIKS